MKELTKEEILSASSGHTYGFTKLELSKSIICPIEALDAMQEYSDQQTKELQEQLAASNSFLDKRCSENNELSVTIHKLEEQLAAKEKESSEAVRLNELMSGYSENQRKIILLLLDGIDSVKQFLPFSTNLKLTEIINASEPFTKPLPTPPSKR